MNQKETPKYATLFYEVMRQLKISVLEYVFLDMVYHLSHRTGYCYKSSSNIASDLGVSKRHVNRMILKLSDRGLIERLTTQTLQVTDVYRNAQTLSGTKSPSKQDKVGTNVLQVGNIVPDREQMSRITGSKNNSKNNIEAPVADKNGTGFKNYMVKRKQLGL